MGREILRIGGERLREVVGRSLVLLGIERLQAVVVVIGLERGQDRDRGQQRHISIIS